MAIEDLLALFHRARRDAQISNKLYVKRMEYEENIAAVSSLLVNYAKWQLGQMLVFIKDTDSTSAVSREKLYTVTRVLLERPDAMDLKPAFRYEVGEVTGIDEGILLNSGYNHTIYPNNVNAYQEASPEAISALTEEFTKANEKKEAAKYRAAFCRKCNRSLVTYKNTGTRACDGCGMKPKLCTCQPL